jgi:F-type H+-transporting ATPase subunit delta
MLAQQVAKKYSAALFNIVKEKGLVDQAFEQFEQLDNLVSSDESLLQFLLAPHILDQDKVTLAREIFASRLEPLFLEFLLVLINKHRIGFLHEIIEEFRARVAEERGIIVAGITTSMPLIDEERKNLIARLEVKTGKTIELKEKVNSKMLGGMVIILGDQIIDGSVRNKLSQLKEELMKLKVA